MDKELSREIILEHFSHPLNKESVNNSKYIKVNSNNPNCIDNIDIYLLIEDNMIKDIKFMGEACAISTASTSIMIKNLIGKNIEDAKKYISDFENMVNEKDYDENNLNEALALKEIYKQNNRKHCALLPYRGIIKAIQDYETNSFR